jgi:hypothetical protein
MDPNGKIKNTHKYILLKELCCQDAWLCCALLALLLAPSGFKRGSCAMLRCAAGNSYRVWNSRSRVHTHMGMTRIGTLFSTP